MFRTTAVGYRCCMRMLLFDLDGVLRQFDPAHGHAIELRHGLSHGSLAAAAFDGPYVEAVITGKIRRVDWIAAAGEKVGSVAAMRMFLGYDGATDPQMVSVMRLVRDGGMPVGLLTNATDTLPDELAWLGLSDDFSVVFNSAALGVAKPNPALFATVLETLGLPAEGRRVCG